MPELSLSVTVALVALAFAGYLARWVLACSPGDGDMPRVAAAIRAVAETFFRRQSNVIGALSALLGGAIFLAYGLLRRPDAGDAPPAVSALELGVWLTVSFALGAACSVLTGRVATFVATRTSVRAAAAARRSLDHALRVALRGGAVSGLFASALGLVALCALVAAVLVHRGALGADPAAALRLVPDVPFMIAGYALGACYAALLAQLGGGTFGKAADVGADAAGREHGFADDDLDNPATVADLAGDAVGDCAARSSGIFASTVVETVTAMLIGAALYRANPKLPSALAVVLFPVVLRAFGLLGAVFGVMVVRTDDREDPISALGRGLVVAAVLHAVGMAGVAKWLLGPAWMRLFGCGAIGAAASVAVLAATLHEVDPARRPVRRLADAARSGPIVALLHGLEAGLSSTIVPLLLVLFAALGAHRLGASTGLVGGGAFGVAVATVGALGTGAYLLAADAFGAIADGAGGIVELCVAQERPDVRGRAMLLDAAGNVAKALTKAHSGAVAALASLLLVGAFLDEVARRLPAAARPTDLSSPTLLIGAVLGVLLVVWFSARCIGMVGAAARRVVDEVRRQLAMPVARGGDAPASRGSDPSWRSGRLVEGRLERGSGASHDACVEVAARLALRQMILPGIVAAAYPILVGLGLRFAKTEDNPRVAADALAALIVAGTIAGVLGTLFLGNAGGAWDNAKKYIAMGAHGGRYLVDETGARSDNPTWSAAAIGDAVGDPLKDTAAPAVHVLVKMIAVITIVFLPFFV